MGYRSIRGVGIVDSEGAARILSEKLNRMDHALSMGEDLDEIEWSDLPDPTGGIRSMNSATNTVLKHYATRLKRQHRNNPGRHHDLFLNIA